MKQCWRAATALCLGLTAVPAAAAPAMWTVRDADTTVHLFGTIHLLAPGTDWRPTELAEAMERSDALWLEYDMLGDTSAALALITKGTSPDRPLKSRLSAGDYAIVVEAAGAADVPMNRIEKLRPWLAAVTLSVDAIRKAGFDATGVDLRLAQDAKERGLPIHGFETGAEQIGFFDSMPEASETSLLVETARMSEPELDGFRKMFAAWEAGDRDALEALLVDTVFLADKKLAEVLLTDRNEAWSKRFEEIMAEPGERVVAVGAGHLIGAGSLPELLKAKGWSVELVTNEK